MMMKRIMKKKGLPLLLAGMLVFTMMPQAAFAKTFGEGDTPQETKSKVIVDYEPGEPAGDPPSDYANPEKINTIKFKEGSLQPFTFYNAEDEIGGNELSFAGKENLTAAQMKDWARIATKIFSSQSQIGGGGGLSGVTWDGLTNNWSWWFENDNMSSGRINLPDRLCAQDRYKKTRETNSDKFTVQVSGLQSAQNLKSVRSQLITDVASVTNHNMKYFEKQRTTNGPTLSALMDDTTRDVYYSYVVHMQYPLDLQVFTANDKFYNAYGIALYDFEYVPIQGDGLRYPGQKEVIDTDNQIKTSTKSYVENPTKDRVSQDITLSTDITQTQSNSLSTASGWNWGASLTGGVTFGDDWPIGLSIQGAGSFNSTLETTKTAGSSVEQHSGSTSNVNGIPVPAQSSVETETRREQTTEYTTYDCPVSLRYKVAVFSLSGSIDAFGKTFSTGDFYTEFSPDSHVGPNGDAISNLYERTQQGSSKSDASLARTEGYYKNKSLMTRVDWSHEAFDEDVTLDGKKEDIKEVIKSRATHLPMADTGMKLDISEDKSVQINNGCIPMYPLKTIALENGLKSEYSMRVNSAYPIGGLTVAGYNANSVLFSGFDPATDQNKGTWSLAETDIDGNQYETGVVELTTDPHTGARKVKALKPGTAALIWTLNETTVNEKGEEVPLVFTCQEGTEVSAKKNPPEYPRVLIHVYDPDTMPASIAFDTDNIADSVIGYEEEPLDLNSQLPVNVKNADGLVIDHAVTYAFADTTIPPTVAEIDPDTGELIAHKAGTYSIVARYEYRDQNDQPQTLTTTDPQTVTVREAKKIQLRPGYNGEDPAGSGTMAPTGQASFDLTGCVSFWDQYGEPWKGNTPDLTYTLKSSDRHGENLEGVAKISGSSLTVEASGIEDTEIFLIRAEAAGNTSIQPVDFRYAVSKDPTADMPEAIEGLVFNNSAQTGVKEGTGYTLKGEKAVDAGWHVAVASLDTKRGFYYWADGSSERARTVRYYIEKATVAVPAAKKLTYNGKAQVGVTAENGTFVENNTATNAGTYTATAELQSKDNYRWPDGTTDDKKIPWSIAAKKTTPSVKLSSTTYTYDGKVKAPSVTVKDGSATLKKDRDYAVSYAPGRKNAGKYDVTVVLKGNYNGWKTVSFTINKAANPMTLKGKTVKVKYSKLKKKTQTIKRSKAFTVSKPQGKVTYAKAGGNKKIKVDKKTGKLTVKKGLKKGTYKVKVKVTAAGTSNYNKAVKKVTVKVRVK